MSVEDVVKRSIRGADVVGVYPLEPLASREAPRKLARPESKVDAQVLQEPDLAILTVQMRLPGDIEGDGQQGIQFRLVGEQLVEWSRALGLRFLHADSISSRG